MSTGSRLSAFLGTVFAHILRKIVGTSEKKLSCKYLMTSRDEKEKASLPVDVNASKFGRVLKKVPKLLFLGQDWPSNVPEISV